MEKVLQYAEFAEECRNLAANLTTLDDKKTLEMMAHAWEAVAKERQQRLSTWQLRGWPSSREEPAMDVKTSNKGGLVNNLWVQMGALAIVAIIVIALAAKYLW